MKDSQAVSKLQLLSGTTWIFCAEAIVLPLGFITVLFITRSVGPEGYGLFVLASTLVSWIEWSINSIFSRTTIKFVSETQSWQEIATTVLRTQLKYSLIATLLLGFLAPAIALLLHEPVLTYLLWLFALEIPLFNLAQAHQNISIGIGNFELKAIANTSRWVFRLVFTVFFIKLGLSIYGAVLASLVGILIDLTVCRYWLNPPILKASGFPFSKLAGYAIPIFFSALAIRIYEKLDLFALKIFGSTTEQVGIYAVAQNLALLGGVMSSALVSVLIATLSKLLSQGETAKAKKLIKIAMRVVLWHFPFAGLVIASAPEIISLLFGEKFLAAAPLFVILIFATIFTVMTAVTNAILIASEKPQWTFWLTVPIPLVAMAGYSLLIPHFGAIGASVATCIVTAIAALAGLVTVYYLWGVLPPSSTLLRCTVVCGVIAWGKLWSVIGLWLLLKLAVLSILIVLLLGLIGEFDFEDRAIIRSWITNKLPKKSLKK